MEIYLSTLDFAQSREKFDLVKHEKWKMLLTTPQPGELHKYYDSTSYISHTDDSRGIVNTLYQIVKQWALRRKIKGLSRFLQKGDKVLDVGAGTGEFVRAARREGWQAEGVEPNGVARDRALEKGVTLIKELGDVSGEYHLITLWHVLEHLPDLEASINQILSRLLPEGTLVLAMPNYCSWDARHYGKYWAAYDVPRHLWHFSRKAVQSIFNEKGLKIIKTRPMWFDAYYIALLSEKYKGGKFKFVKAFWNGSRSNLAAMRTGEYSSLTYVLKRV